ncbi:pseudouridylate synthase TRUB2, mitochondrial isoform X1 [Scleropages formosus]|uniref:TruB pseudouridine (psi) synthase family member 2 n=1 Tax=Scleropages formosus TaxID=113540 RepID=A0A8C9T319_SCLFO|nr:mitochondrial mRNA pseudouridine synthase TRUB2 isoform X1 [Scleropages formosus]
MGRPAARLYRALEGLFAVYKPPGVHWKLVRDTVETNLLRGLNGAPRPAPRSQVKFLPEPCRDNRVTLEASVLPVLADHPLVAGPQFQKLRVGVGHRLDVFSSGILVLGVGQGNVRLTEMYNSHNTRDYTLEGEFGRATDDFSCHGRVIERTTYGHVTKDKLESVLAMIQGVNQKALLTYSNVDMRSQEAYELAAKGSLRPQSKSPPIITGLRCLKFAPPHFTLEVHCVNETQKYLRRLVHEIGLELRSSAVCTGVRRERDGPFKLQHALTRQHWTLPDITQAVHCSWATWTGGEVNTVQPEPHKPLTMG